jgi:hypothetical protein
MKFKLAGLAAILGVSLFSFVMPANGQDVTINFTGVANPNVQALGAYAGYYTGTVTSDGVTTASNPGFICDDFNNEIFLPSESWQATATSFASLVTPGGVPTAALSTTLFGSTIGIAGYAGIAFLAAEMNGASAQTQADLSAAIWYIGAVGSGTYTGPLGKDSIAWSSLDAAAQTYITDLSAFGSIGGSVNAAEINVLESSSLWLYTPTGQGIVPSGDPYPQEFVGSVAVLAVPEGGAAIFYLLLAMLACAGAIFISRRKRIVA